jgi:ATP-binding cassette subfamily F protein 3
VQAAAAKKQEAERAHLQAFVDRFRAKATKAKAGAEPGQDAGTDDADPHAGGCRADGFPFPEPEELSPPIVNLDGAAVGYGGKPVLSRLNLRIDQDDRIALLGRNGEGKSTLSKLLAGKLHALEGGHILLQAAHRLFRAAPGR